MPWQLSLKALRPQFEQQLTRRVQVYSAVVLITRENANAVSRRVRQELGKKRPGRAMYGAPPISVKGGWYLSYLYGPPEEAPLIARLATDAAECLERIPAGDLPGVSLPEDLPFPLECLIRWLSFLYRTAWWRPAAMIRATLQYSPDPPSSLPNCRFLPWQEPTDFPGFDPRAVLTFSSGKTEHLDRWKTRYARQGKQFPETFYATLEDDLCSASVLAIDAALASTARDGLQRLTLNLDDNTMVLDGRKYKLEDFEARELDAIRRGRGLAITSNDIAAMPLCQGRNIARDIKRLRKNYPPLRQLIKSRRGYGYYLCVGKQHTSGRTSDL